MRDTTIASRYAKALFLVTEKRGETARALEDLRSVHELLKPGTRAHAVSAVPLTPEEVDRLVLELERVTHGKIRMTTEVDPGVVGGALVRIGDRVIDRTVKTLLEAISKQLDEASV